MKNIEKRRNILENEAEIQALLLLWTEKISRANTVSADSQEEHVTPV